MLSNVKSTGPLMFVHNNPNINWINPTHWCRTKQLFHQSLDQVHLSAISSHIRLDQYVFTGESQSLWDRVVG
jgi:hypothetical protein